MSSILYTLFFEFFKIGLFTYGGGLAILVFLQQRSVELGWLTVTQFADIIAVAQSTPGPIAINLATFVGYLQGGLPGVLLASLAVCIPGFVLSLVIAKFMHHFNEYPVVIRLMRGLRGIVIGLIAIAIINIFKVSFFSLGGVFDGKALILLIVIGLGIYKFKWHPIVYIVSSAVLGMVIWA